MRVVKTECKRNMGAVMRGVGRLVAVKGELWRSVFQQSRRKENEAQGQWVSGRGIT